MLSPLSIIRQRVNPSYCFVAVSRLEATLEVPHRVPLTATQYIRTYYPAEEARDAAHEESILSTIASLDNYSSQRDDHVRASGHDSSSTNTETPSPGIDSLLHLALKPSIDRALEIGNIQGIEQLVWLPGKAKAIMSILKAHNLFPDSTVPLLAQVINHRELSRNVNLSNFVLSTAQILSLVNQFDNVETLEFVTINTVHAVLDPIVGLKQLVLFFNLEVLTHPLLLDATKTTQFPNAFAFTTKQRHGHDISVASIPFFTPSLIVQALSDYMTELLNESSASFSPQAAFSSTVRTGNETWATRTIPWVAGGSFDGVVNGDGWLFAMESGYPYRMEYKYAFVKKTKSEHTTGAEVSEESEDACEVGEMKAQGRPSAPDPAVNALCALFDHMKAELMDAAEVNVFIKPVYIPRIPGPQFYY
ncbi:hypothetical protein DXG01_009469 [Tephrocybe rancida]|nr:hypothetical protein DXG01_009469 [Tephrocybe rancida]